MSDPCGRWRKLLSLGMDGALSAKQQKQLEAHLRHCEVCREAYESYKALRGHLLQEDSFIPQADCLEEKVLEALAQPQLPTFWERFSPALTFMAQAASAAIATGVVTWILLFPWAHKERLQAGLTGEMQLTQGQAYIPRALSLPLNAFSPRAALLWHQPSPVAGRPSANVVRPR